MADDGLLWLSGINAVFVLVLVIITGFYAWCTHRIVEESAKDRQIRRIEKALEEFYYPLMETKNLDRYRYPPIWERTQLDVMVYHNERLERFWAGVKKHQHLAERGTIDTLESFFEHSNHYWVQARVPEAKADLVTARNDLIAEVKKDMKILEGKLKKLHS